MTNAFRWHEGYSVGVQQFDADHRRLLNLAEEMVLAARQQAQPLTAGEVLEDLIAYAEEHFLHEERLMQTTGYAGLQEHQTEHRRLLDEIRRYQADMGQGRVNADDVARYVADWIFGHIDSEDRKYGDHLNGRGYR
jgi:hemerythrin-like metal-binding protein